jgi:hypothetical protein
MGVLSGSNSFLARALTIFVALQQAVISCPLASTIVVCIATAHLPPPLAIILVTLPLCLTVLIATLKLVIRRRLAKNVVPKTLKLSR